ncbi:hypothetical protein D9757_014296 [Collybiopsis confluens]|uniref:FAD-binding domain-containing protein n=1 Tax=Collybiopsis confluens TaxID=2823264 RepID=A0A8H5CUE5_9AGAR|nr:hypothetical protein D9757_014296 [Collybiopsis confluens]
MAYLQLVLISPILLYGVLWVFWGLLRWHLLKKHSGFLEIEKLDKTSETHRLQGTAVICGGSIAGLLAARVCHDFFERVVIVEPEKWLTTEDGIRQFSWEQENSRSRIMQYQSLHGNLPLLYTALTKLFPSFDKHCADSGLRIQPAFVPLTYAGVPIVAPIKSYNNQLPKTLQSSRMGLETLIRRLVLSQECYPRIEQITGTVIGTSPSPDDSSYLRTIRVRKADMEIIELEAAMVADCTGTTRAGAKWLSHAGYGATNITPVGKLSLQDAKISLDQKLHYTSLTCKVSSATWEKLPIPGDQIPEDLGYIFQEELPDRGRRMFVLLRVEGNQLVFFAGQCTDEPRKYESLDAMQSYLRSLVPIDPKHPVPEWIFQIINILKETHTPITFSHVRVPPTSYIRYHRTMNLPRNFIAVGDSVMSIDPLFGQGCTKAMLGAVVLHSVLSTAGINGGTQLPSDFSNSFFKDHFNKTDDFWQTTRLLDYGVPCTKPIPGEDLRSGDRMRWYIKNLQLLSIKDEQARRALYDGGRSLGSAVDAVHPWLVVKVMWAQLISFIM